MLSTSLVWAENNVNSALSKYAWDKRQIIVFTPSIDHPEYKKFLQSSMRQSTELQERNLQSWHVVGSFPVTLENDINDKFTAKDIRLAFEIEENEFRLVLIGYDQGEKLRLTRTDLTQIFTKIDKMPMRIQELQKSN